MYNNGAIGDARWRFSPYEEAEASADDQLPNFCRQVARGGVEMPHMVLCWEVDEASIVRVCGYRLRSLRIGKDPNPSPIPVTCSSLLSLLPSQPAKATTEEEQEVRGASHSSNTSTAIL